MAKGKFLETLDAVKKDISLIIDQNEAERQRNIDRLELAKAEQAKAEAARFEADKQGDYEKVEKAIQDIKLCEDKISYYSDRLASIDNDPMIDLDRYEELKEKVNDAYRAEELEHIKTVTSYIDKIKDFALTETDHGNQANELFYKLDSEIMRKNYSDPRTKWAKVEGFFLIPWFTKDISDPENGRAGHYYGKFKELDSGTEGTH